MSKARVTDLRLLRVMEYIEEHIGTDLSLEVLARETGVSPSQCATLFQRQISMSPNKIRTYPENQERFAHTLRDQPVNDGGRPSLRFQNSFPFRSCISQVFWPESQRVPLRADME